MLVLDKQKIGNKLLTIRKRLGMTQSEAAEAAELSDRTYADIERGIVNMHVETILRICNAFHITPDEILTEENPTLSARQEEILQRLNSCSPKDRETALSLLEVFLRSLT